MKNNVKIIFHIDLNAFFISCEQINNPELKNTPLAISGKLAAYNKGVVMTASYEARKFGVKSAMPVFQAKQLCPQLLIITGNMALYKDYSNRFFSFLSRYTSLIEMASIDEGYLDVTKACETKHPLILAQEIQDTLYQTLQLPCSIGIASNKFLAKMASEMKKPMGITVLRRREVESLLWPLPIHEMFGIGKKTAPKLIAEQILTIGDLAKGSRSEAAKRILGNQYEHFYLNANGYGNTVVDPSKNDEYKSIGNSLTYHEIIVSETVAYQKLKDLAQTVTQRLNHHHYLAKTITVQIRDTSFKTRSKSKTLPHYFDQYDLIYQTVITLFDELWDHIPIRLLGVSLGSLTEKKEIMEQLDLFTYEHHTNDEQLIKIMNQIKRQFGEKAIKKGNK